MWSFNVTLRPEGVSTICRGDTPAYPGNVFPVEDFGTEQGCESRTNGVPDFFSLVRRYKPLMLLQLEVLDDSGYPGWGLFHDISDDQVSTESGAERYIGPTSFSITLPPPEAHE